MRRDSLLLLLLWGCSWCWAPAHSQSTPSPGDRKIGDRCDSVDQCGFVGAECTFHKCQCKPDLKTNHLDKCGPPVGINETCFFHEQCEDINEEIECRDGACACRFEKEPMVNIHGKVECIFISNRVEPGVYIDPAMIGILVAMFLMFITICVVLRLFSRARWHENRTIFNTPNPRLMNASLLRENKLERKGSKGSGKGPSRQPSMASIRAYSPNSHGSPRGSKRSSSNASLNKSPHQSNPSSVTTPMLESVTVEIQDGKSN